MLKQSLLAIALAAAVPACFAQAAGSANAPGSALGSSGSTLGQPGSTLGSPATPGQSTGTPAIPSTGALSRPGDTRLPGSDTTPGLSTLPGVSDPLERNSSFGSSTLPDPARIPAAPGSQITPGVLGPAPGVGGRPVGPCTPGSISNPC
jgi:hypothetical protein